MVTRAPTVIIAGAGDGGQRLSAMQQATFCSQIFTHLDIIAGAGVGSTTTWLSHIGHVVRCRVRSSNRRHPATRR